MLVGAVYLTHANEIGIAVLKASRRQGFGTEILEAMLERHPKEKLLANISPQNSKSSVLFGKLGFELKQLTMVRES
jgi:RimJ/RimL family protein N-acetyltransferase